VAEGRVGSSRVTDASAVLFVPGESGYTLTEIMISLAIVSLMLGGAAIAAFGQFEKARKKETINMMRKIKDGVLQWRMDATGEQCPSSLADLVTTKVLTKEPKDGWGRPFVIKCPGEHDTDGVDLYQLWQRRQRGHGRRPQELGRRQVSGQDGCECGSGVYIAHTAVARGPRRVTRSSS
jgi:prepilin-type N-terminal cleavage/methylation domain-containing protein